jgi:hypothetical protein
MKPYALSLLPCLALAAQAHQGHGQAASSHWHASDTWGFVMVAAAVALGWWLNKRK